MNKKLLLAAAGLLGAAPTAVLAGPAAADPSQFAVPVSVSCDNGQVYAAVFQGAATWNVSLDTGSNAVLVPTSQQFNGVRTDAAGNVVFEFHDPVVTKGKSAGRQPNQSLCSFDFTIASADGSTFHGYGTATFFITPGS